MLLPDLYLSSIFSITPGLLKGLGVEALVLDVDNTLRAYKSDKPYKGVSEWIEKMRKSGISLIVASNNLESSVGPFAATLKLDYVSMSFKPLPFGLKRALRKLKIDRRKVAIVGDQIFTDIIGGRLSGFRTILVKPFVVERGISWRIRRFFEKPVIIRYNNKKSRRK